MNSFIRKLVKQNSIKITSPSDEVSESYLSKSEKSIISSKTLLNIKHFDDAIALTYFSMYYSALALLFKCGIKSENHTGTIILLKELFDINNLKIKTAKKERIDKQYYVNFKATENEVKKGIIIAEDFNAEIKEEIDTIKISKILQIREKFKKDYF